MLKLIVNSIEKKRLLYYAEHSLFEKAHWGDGEVLVPEERILLDQFKSRKTNIELTLTQLRILINWFLESTGYGNFLLEEDFVIMNKLIDLVLINIPPSKKEFDFYTELIKLKVAILTSVVNPQKVQLMYSNRETGKRKTISNKPIEKSKEIVKKDKSIKAETKTSGTKPVKKKKKISDWDAKVARVKMMRTEMKQADDFIKRIKKKTKKMK